MFVSSVFCFQWFCFLFCFWWGDLKWGIPWWVLAKVCEIFLKSFLFSFFFWIFWVFDDSWYLCYLMSFWCSLGLLTALCLVPEKMEDNKVMSRVKRLLVLFLKAENKPNDCFELTWSNLRIKVLFLFLFDIKILNFFLVHFPHYSFLSVGHSIFFFSPQDSEFTFCLFPHCFSLCLTSCYFIYLSSRTKFFQFGLWMKMSVACNAWCQIWFQEVIEINFYCIWLIWLVEHWFSRVMHNISNTFGLSRLFFFFLFFILHLLPINTDLSFCL